MPKLWRQTVQEHRRTVRDAIVDTAWVLAAERGAPAVTMSLLAERVGIGRATLYKYFPDVAAVLVAAHERQVGAHIERLTAARDAAGDPAEQLEAVLTAYAHISHHRGRHGTEELAALVHRGEYVLRAQAQLHTLLQDLLAAAVRSGGIRDDVATDELAAYCLQALGAAGGLSSEAAVGRLVRLVLDGLRPSG